MRSLILAALICLALARGAAAADLTGKPQIVDGDTILLDGRRIDLAGIRAPEAGQTCRRRDGTPYDCGQMATFALAGIIETHWVVCRPVAESDAGALFALCKIGPYDVGAEMVRRGWAVADGNWSDGYGPEEEAARAARRGLWQ